MKPSLADENGRYIRKGNAMNDQDMADLRALIDKARAEKKWLWCSYQDLWFSPDNLQAENDNGRFRWGVVNWRLRDPQERVSEAKARADAASGEYARIQRMVNGA